MVPRGRVRQHTRPPFLDLLEARGYAGRVRRWIERSFGLAFLRRFLRPPRLCLVVLILTAARAGFAWGPEGHKAVAILAVRYMRPDTRSRVRELLGSENIEDASLWADTIAHSSRTGTASWHYIDIPLRNSRIDLRRDCPGNNCVLAKTEEFLAVLGDPRSAQEARRDALKFVLHFVADLHQPLHCEDNHDKGGNTQQVIFEGHPDNLHWVWDTGLVQEINPDAKALAAMLGRRITEQDRTAWEQGNIPDWVMEAHRLAQTAAYRRSWIAGAPRLDPAYDADAEDVIKLQLEKAAVRLAYVLNRRLGDPSSDCQGH